MQVLVLDARSDRLLLCGSVRQGACYRHSPTDFTVNTEQLLTAVAANTEAASTFGFIGPQQVASWNIYISKCKIFFGKSRYYVLSYLY